MLHKTLMRTSKRFIQLNFIPHLRTLNLTLNNHYAVKKIMFKNQDQDQSQIPIKTDKPQTIYGYEQQRTYFQVKQITLKQKRVGPDYWPPVYEKLQSPVKKIIISINILDQLYEQANQMQKNKTMDRKKIGQIAKIQKDLFHLINSYLIFDQYGIHDARTIYGISALILAMDQTYSKQIKLNMYKAAEFFIPVYFQQQIYLKHSSLAKIERIQKDKMNHSLKDIDTHMVISILSLINSSISAKSSPNLRTKFQLKFLKLLKAITQYHPKYIQTQGKWSMFAKEEQFLLLIKECNAFLDNKKNMSPIFLTRMQFLFDYLTNEVIKISERQSNNQSVVSSHLLTNYLSLAINFEFKSKEIAQKILWIILQSINQGTHFTKLEKIIMYLNGFPSFIYYDSEKKEICDVRDRLVYRVNRILYQNQRILSYINQLEQFWVLKAFKRILDQNFYTKFLSLNFSMIQNHTLIIFDEAQNKNSKERNKRVKIDKIDDQIQDLGILPQMNRLNRHIYRNFYKKINKSELLFELIKNYYPDMLKQNASKNYDGQSNLYINDNIDKKLNKKQVTDNEMSLIVIKMLNSLDIKFFKQKKIIGRKADFYIPALNLIIEVDGDFHFDTKTLPNPKTCHRNLTFLNAGYKLMIITCQDINENRDIANLKNIYLKKLELMQKYNASYVF